MIQARVTDVPIPPEVAAFAAEQGVTDVLPAVLDLTRRVFPHARLILAVEDDPEIANDRHVVINAEDVDVPGAEATANIWEWHRGLLAVCPAPLAAVFRMTVRGVR